MNGIPIADPFRALTAIDNTLGFQTFVWNGVPNGADPGSPPAPVIFGRNTFVSTYEIECYLPSDWATLITPGGNVVTAISWNVYRSASPFPGPDGVFGTPDDVPGYVIYGPLTPPPMALHGSHLILDSTPAPASASVLGLAALICGRRRRVALLLL